MPEELNSLKRERFLRLAPRRVTAVLKKLQVLSNCANRLTYEYTEDDIRQIFDAIDKAVAIAKSKFEQKRPADFSFR